MFEHPYLSIKFLVRYYHNGRNSKLFVSFSKNKEMSASSNISFVISVDMSQSELVTVLFLIEKFPVNSSLVVGL